MTNSPKPDPHSSGKSPLGFDEFIAVLIALGTIGTILFWGISKKPDSFNLVGVKRSQPEPENVTGEVLPTPIPRREENRVIERPTARIPIAIAPPAKVEPSPIPAAPIPRSEGQIIPKIPPAIIIAPPKVSPPVTQVKYKDVANNFWATPFIVNLTRRGVFRGFTDGTFRPNQPMTRAEFAVRLGRTFNQAPQETATDFEDVPSNYWAYSAIKQSNITGFIEGYPQDYFKPNKPITRVEAIVALASGLDLKKASNSEQILQQYQDAVQIPKYAREKVAAATEAGLVVSSNPKLFKPNQAATRADVAGFLYQGLVKRGKVNKIDSQAIVKP